MKETMDRMFTENDKIRYKNFYLVLNNPTTDEFDELPIEVVKSIIPVVDKEGNSGLLITYYDDELCCTRTLSCDNASIRIEEIRL